MPTTKIFVQQFECNEPLQLCVARFIHGAYPTGTKRFHRHQMIEGSLQQILLPAVPADHLNQRFITTGIDHDTAYPTRCRLEQLPLIHMEIDCNIDEFEGKAWP
jgi:hypothetical protein